MLKTVHVQYCATLRRQHGLAAETLTTNARDAEALYRELHARHAFTLPPADVRAAINGESAPQGTPLADGDEIAFLPFVAGG